MTVDCHLHLEWCSVAAAGCVQWEAMHQKSKGGFFILSELLKLPIQEPVKGPVVGCCQPRRTQVFACY